MGLMSGKITAKAKDGQEKGAGFWGAPPKTAPAAARTCGRRGRGGRGESGAVGEAFRHASLPCYTEGVMVRRQVPSFSTR